MIAKRTKCRQRRPSLFLDLSALSPAVSSAVKETSRRAAFLPAATCSMSQPFRFVRDPAKLKAELFPSSSSAAPAAAATKL